MKTEDHQSDSLDTAVESCSAAGKMKSYSTAEGYEK